MTARGTPDSNRILIAGGGPVGLFCALLLGRRGLSVRVFDSNDTLQRDPRAATTHPATLEILEEAGLVGDMIEVGLVVPKFQFWDRVTGRKVAEFNHSLLEDDTQFPYVVQCEQFKTTQLILDRLRIMPNVEVHFSKEVVDVTQTADEVAVTVDGSKGLEHHTGAYLVGADGARSIVRKKSAIEFHGFTYPERFLVLTTPFDFEAQLGYCPRSYFADPKEWCNCFKVADAGPPGLWRTVFPTNPELSDEEILSDDSVQRRIQNLFPISKPYEIVHRNLYVTHQRVANRFRLGRVLLAGDSAHVNNSIGGMGLNGGLQDAANVADKIARVVVDKASSALLDLYDRQRRTVTIEFVQQQTIDNKKRLEARDPEVRRRNLAELTAIARDTERSRQFLLRSSMIAMQRRADAITLENA